MLVLYATFFTFYYYALPFWLGFHFNICNPTWQCSDSFFPVQGGGGISCVMEDGAVFEKAGVNISAIHGTLSPAAVREMRARWQIVESLLSYIMLSHMGDFGSTYSCSLWFSHFLILFFLPFCRHSEIDVDKDCKFFACGISSVIHPVSSPLHSLCLWRSNTFAFCGNSWVSQALSPICLR